MRRKISFDFKEKKRASAAQSLSLVSERSVSTQASSKAFDIAINLFNKKPVQAEESKNLIQPQQLQNQPLEEAKNAEETKR